VLHKCGGFRFWWDFQLVFKVWGIFNQISATFPIFFVMIFEAKVWCFPGCLIRNFKPSQYMVLLLVNVKKGWHVYETYVKVKGKVVPV
jgi:hypothetical protein